MWLPFDQQRRPAFPVDALFRYIHAPRPLIRPQAGSFLIGWLCLTIAGCGGKSEKSVPAEPVLQAPFRDAAEAARLDFRHENGMVGERYILEIMGPGGALFDFDGDGDLDLFLVQGQSLARSGTSANLPAPRHRLFRNDLTRGAEGTSSLRFTDISDDVQLTYSDYGMGVIAGDYNRDGRMDLFVSCYGGNRLLQNAGGERFIDVTQSAGLGSAPDSPPAWSTSAAWGDIDRDGDLDLFICQYLDWTFETHQPCRSPWGGHGYCGPKMFTPSRSKLYRNQGDGTFADVSESSQIASLRGAALGVVAADLDGDGWTDFFVANDAMPNHFWVNRRDGTFSEEAVQRGCAVNAEGMAEGNMGIVAADFHNSGQTDLFITHLKTEHATFYRNLGEGQFADVTAGIGLDAPTRAYTGFGTGGIDYDNDGALDIFATNGSVQIDQQQEQAGIAVPLRQRSLLFRNRGRSQPLFEPVEGVPCLEVEEVGRGAAFGDIDNDGDIDIVISNNHGPVRLLINDVGQKNHWIGLRLVEGEPGTEIDVYGAIARFERPGEPTLTRRCATDGSYLSSSDPRILFGLGESSGTGTIRVRWPDGAEQVWENLSPNQYHVLRRTRTATKDTGAVAPASLPANPPQP